MNHRDEVVDTDVDNAMLTAEEANALAARQHARRMAGEPQGD